jgi:hypothetical protein
MRQWVKLMCHTRLSKITVSHHKAQNDERQFMAVFRHIKRYSNHVTSCPINPIKYVEPWRSQLAPYLVREVLIILGLICSQKL